MSKFLIFMTLNFIFFNHSVYAAQLRLSAEELKQISKQEKTVILDVRNKNDYDVGHIENAIHFPVGLTYDNQKTNGKIQQPKLMQLFFRERGIDTKSKVVVYDEGIMIDAARLFWALEVYGIADVKVLDKGFKYWSNKEFPVSQVRPVVTPSQYVTTINHKRLASKFATQLAIYNKNKVVVDARSLPAYQGKTSVAKRYGHISSAINVPFTNNIIQNAEYSGLKPIAELNNIYGDIPKDKKLIIYCKVGRVSTTNYFALRELGYDVANYDASWREWGNDDSLPIER